MQSGGPVTTESIVRFDAGGHLVFWCLGSSRYKKWYQGINTYCWKRVSRVKFNKYYGLYDSKQKKMELVDGGHLEFWYLDSSKHKNVARNGLSMPHLVGKVILHGFLWPFTFKLHFQYGHRRPSWILMAGLVKIQKRCQKWILYAKISRKSGITQLSTWICFQITLPIWPPAAILDFGFSQIPPPFLRGSWELIFFWILQRAQIKCQTLLCSQWSRDPQIAPN